MNVLLRREGLERRKLAHGANSHADAILDLTSPLLNSRNYSNGRFRESPPSVNRAIRRDRQRSLFRSIYEAGCNGFKASV